MGTRHFSQQQKFAILNSAAEIGVRQAAELAGVHYTSVYDWRRQLVSLGETLCRVGTVVVVRRNRQP